MSILLETIGSFCEGESLLKLVHPENLDGTLLFILRSLDLNF